MKWTTKLAADPGAASGRGPAASPGGPIMAVKAAAEGLEKASPGGFRGFGSEALPFLRALRENNDRQWFAAHRTTFLEECDTPLRELVGEVAGRLIVRGLPLAPVARKPVFRIHRDVRFSRDKSPYKTNLGAALYRDGEKGKPGALYIHVEPAGSFVAAGFFHPAPPALRALRSAIAGDPATFDRLIHALESLGHTLVMGRPLTRMPRGFEPLADLPVAGHLRNRSFVLHRPLADEDLESRGLPETIAGFAADAAPFLDFFWSRTGVAPGSTPDRA